LVYFNNLSKLINILKFYCNFDNIFTYINRITIIYLKTKVW